MDPASGSWFLWAVTGGTGVNGLRLSLLGRFLSKENWHYNLTALCLYAGLKANPNMDFVPRTVMIGGKVCVYFTVLTEQIIQFKCH